jgi:hypothetical protein
MTTPTIGRTIYVFKRHARYGSPEPEIGFITHVNEDGTINVKGFTHEGGDFVLHSLPLRQDGDPDSDVVHAEWMPYQKAVARGEIPPVQHAPPKEPEPYGEPSPPV